MHSACPVVLATLLLASLTLAQEGRDGLGDPLPAGAVQRLGTLRLKYPGVADFCYLPDGRAVVVVGKSIEIWDLAQGEKQATHEVCDQSLATVMCRRDGQALLFADRAGNVREWDLDAQREIRSWPTEQAGLSGACYSPDETRVLTFGRLPPTLKQWDLATGEQLIEIEGGTAYFARAVYGAEGKTAWAGGGYEHVLEHYDLATGECLQKLLKNYCVYDMALSPDGQRLLVGSRTYASEWDCAAYEQLGKFTGHHGHAAPSVAYSGHPDEVFTGSRDGSIRRWNRHEAKVVTRWFPHQGHVTRMRVSPDGKWILSYGGGLIAESDAETGEPRIEWDRHAGTIQAAAFLPSGEQAVSGSADGTLRVWDLATGKTAQIIEGANLGAFALAVSPDGKRVAAGCKDGHVREFALADSKLLRDLAGHLGWVRSVAYTEDGRLLSSADDGSVRVWAPGGNEPAAVLQGHRGGVLSVAASPDGKLALSGGRDGTMRLWDLAEGKLLQTIDAHRGWVECVLFAGDAGHALSSGRDGRVLRWDLAAGEPVATMTHGSWVKSLACTADGSHIYSGADDRRVVVWDSTGEQIAEFKGHQGPILALAASPDGRLVLSGSADTTLLVWALED